MRCTPRDGCFRNSPYKGFNPPTSEFGPRKRGTPAVAAAPIPLSLSHSHANLLT